MKLAQINRKLDLARRNYEDYAQRFEQTRIDLALSEKNLSNLSILQPPSRSKIPSNPKVMLTLFVGATIAAFVSLLVSIASTCVVVSQRVIRQTGIPILSNWNCRRAKVRRLKKAIFRSLERVKRIEFCKVQT